MNSSSTATALPNGTSKSWLLTDFIAGIVVFLVALPLCLGIALASGAPLFSGIISGIIGGIVVGALSGSRISVSGPAAGLTAIVAARIADLGSFESFLLAVFLAGVIQIALGVAKAGAFAAFVPTSVINGLLAAIGVILILKQIPHLLGHDTDPEGEMSFVQPDHENTLTELLSVFQGEIHVSAVVIGLVSIALLIVWGKVPILKKSLVPGPLIVVVLGVVMNELFKYWGSWGLESSHLVVVPVAESLSGFTEFFVFPNWSDWNRPRVYEAAVTIAIVATLETLLNVEAVDKLDPLRCQTPTNRELMAQGCGNMFAGLIGGLPMTSVIVRSSVNLNAGVQTKASAIFHGVLLLASVALLPQVLNMIPLSALAAILIVTGFKLARPELFRQMLDGGRYQFIPFLTTLLAIVFTDLLIGILIGLAVSVAFILNSNLRCPVRTKLESHLLNKVLRIELGDQVSFLNKASLEKVLHSAKRGTHIVFDASNSNYIDPDILTLIREFRNQTAPAHGVEVSYLGFRSKYGLADDVKFMDYTTRELQQLLTPDDVLEILVEGNERFAAGDRLTRDFRRQLSATSDGQHPYAVILSCIDSRAPVETIMDLGLGDVFSVRIAGNVTSEKVLGSMEYACAVAGAKLIVVLGHSKCGAVTSTVDFALSGGDVKSVTGCDNLHSIVHDIESVVGTDLQSRLNQGGIDKAALVEEVSQRNVLESVRRILANSPVLCKLVESERVGIIGAKYDVSSGKIEFFKSEAQGFTSMKSMKPKHEKP